ncbi:hypothetical protein ACNS7O_00010 [Haloferacaceae archaeon DSL9]
MTDEERGDTFGVGIRVTDAELQFVVHVPSEIDSGWTDPTEFQRLVEQVVWERLDRDATLRRISATTPAGQTASLGTVTLTPEGRVVDETLSQPNGNASDPSDQSTLDDGR